MQSETKNTIRERTLGDEDHTIPDQRAGKRWRDVNTTFVRLADPLLAVQGVGKSLAGAARGMSVRLLFNFRVQRCHADVSFHVGRCKVHVLPF